jgi:hypothetical protein
MYSMLNLLARHRNRHAALQLVQGFWKPET